ncbi:MAG: hypothetical protein ACON4Z_01950 [Planctomycetota bacterium]
MPLDVPGHGDATRVQVGRAELVLENRRGSFSLLWSDGRDARRYVLGLTEAGELCVELRVPRLPLRCVPRDVVTLVPGARLQGYVTVPLVPTLVWRSGASAGEPLVEMLPDDLQGVWDEATGHAFEVGVAWLSRFPFRSGAAQAVVPLRLANAGDEVVSPAYLDVSLTDDALWELRGALVVRPQRLTWPPAEGGRVTGGAAR